MPAFSCTAHHTQGRLTDWHTNTSHIETQARLTGQQTPILAYFSSYTRQTYRLAYKYFSYINTGQAHWSTYSHSGILFLTHNAGSQTDIHL